MPITRPKPLQVSQAPIGELKEKRAGRGSLKDRLQAAQARLLENLLIVSVSRSTIWHWPSPNRRAVSMASVTRARSRASLQTKRSVITRTEPLVRACTLLKPWVESHCRRSSSDSESGASRSKQMAILVPVG